MGKGDTNKSNCGFNISDRKSLLSNCDSISLTTLAMADAYAIPPKIWIEDNLDRPFDGGGGGVGPTGSNSGGANEVVVDPIIRRDEYVSSSSSSFLDAKNSAITTNTNLQPFHIFASYSTKPYKSPEEMVPLFTSVQWKELERQAMIYKYMISSVPVPPHLLYSPLHSSVSSLYNHVGFSQNGAALEPGRCKRTDGKKWRCSRDVAPHQKYCERHLHRGRPRSRKPVEVNDKNNGDENHKKPRLQQTPKQFTTANEEPLLLFNAKTDLTSISTAPSHKGTNRDLGLMIESEMVAMNVAEQKLQHLLEANMGFANEGSSIYGSSSIYHQDYVDQQPLSHGLSYSNFPTSEIDAPIGFIDAWSVDNLNSITNNVNVESSSSMNHENFSPSLDLSIAMAGGNVVDEEMGSVQMRDGVDFYGEDARWLSPVLWEPFGPGGPLAEALCANPASPHHSISRPATTVSSPSGVLQRTLFSNSDSSVCNSPSEIAFQRIK